MVYQRNISLNRRSLSLDVYKFALRSRKERERRGGGSKKEQTNFLIDPRYYLEFIVSAAIGTARVLFVAP